MAIPGARDAGMAVRRAGREAGPWIERLARLGYAAKGLVYVLVGFLALRTALGRGGEITDSEGALRTLLDQPFGIFSSWPGTIVSSSSPLARTSALSVTSCSRAISESVSPAARLDGWRGEIVSFSRKKGQKSRKLAFFP